MWLGILETHITWKFCGKKMTFGILDRIVVVNELNAFMLDKKLKGISFSNKYGESIWF